MSAEYSAVSVKGGKLRLKGGAGSQLKKKSKRKRNRASRDQEYAEGELKHGENLSENIYAGTSYSYSVAAPYTCISFNNTVT